MGRLIREYGYVAVMCICLACSSVLLWSVSTGRPLAAVAETHLPVLRATSLPAEEPPETEVRQTAPAAAGYLLTEKELEEHLADFLPDSFPASRVEADVEDGRVELSFAAERAELEAWLKGMGFKQGLLLKLLPRKPEMKVSFVPSADENGLHLRPDSMELGDTAIDLRDLPEGLFSAVDEGLNGLLKSRGVSVSALEFTREGLLLK